MIDTIVLITAIALPVLVATGAVLYLMLRRRSKPLNEQYFQEKWKELQKLLADKDAWKQAVCDADKLLDEALRKKRFRGKGMGERLVKAQRLLTDNDGVWYGHKLRTKLEHEPEMKLKEADVKQALVGIRQALKDLGALSSDQSRNPK